MGNQHNRTVANGKRKLVANRVLMAGAAALFLAACTGGTPVRAAGNLGTVRVATLGVTPVNHPRDAGQTTRVQNPGVVSWVHFGDLHITTGDQQNYLDFQRIVANTNQYLLNGINFAVLPGDNANDDTASEYELIKGAVSALRAPLYSVPGDHDSRSGYSLYEQYMEPRLYQSFSAGGYHFAFLDVMNGISIEEMSWLTRDLSSAKTAGLKSVLFMHSYNAVSGLQNLIQNDNVIMVDAGHTHTNAVANDGHTVYAATRSTGQISEGPVGFSIVNLDNGVISWKFKPLGSWPFVMITSPADKGLIVNSNQVVRGIQEIRAKIWDDRGVASATYQVDGGTSRPLQRIGMSQMWEAPFNFSALSNGDHKIRVDVRGAGGNTTQDTIAIAAGSPSQVRLSGRSFGPWTNSLGVYTEKGLLGNAGGGRGPGVPGRRGPRNGISPAGVPGGPCGGPGKRGGKRGRGPRGLHGSPPPPPANGTTPPAPPNGGPPPPPCGK